ncbi:hypothetical protein DFR58_10865 [Anaerobacterium chartisolvens]|uniref:Uncharacterized protein n=1 Tax=Anaerobacterium chartisolvens TaxID=1297424 RepID=A0A369B6W3_9FIRM|nr:hypothetical protein [Anaerobacterium chartisolvens]RCX17171.1 hypothetical protein DFR58_10865 [Anaerobacterium chartisolvens]
MKKIIIVSLSIILIGVVSIYLYNYFTFKNAFDKAGIVTLGKTLIIEVNESDIRDYNFIEKNQELGKWKESEKNSFINYMKEKKLILKPGAYEINQGTAWEKAIEIFQFE